MGFLLNPFMFAADTGLEYSVTSTRTSTGGTSPITLTGISLGAEPPPGKARHAVMTITGSRSNGTNGAVTGATIFGITANLIVASGTANATNSYIFIAEVPTGSGTGSITVSSSAAYNRWSIVTYRLIGLESALAFATRSNSGNLSVPEGGVAFAALNSGGPIASITGVDEDYNISSGTLHLGVHGSLQVDLSQTLALSFSPVGSRFVAASFR